MAEQSAWVSSQFVIADVKEVHLNPFVLCKRSVLGEILPGLRLMA